MIPFTIIILGAVLRFYLAIYRQDLVWPDEHFQTLEPAAQLIFGYSFKTWEWTEGFRNWIAPLFFTPPLLLSKVIGFSGGATPIIFSRLWIAALSSASTFFFYNLLKNLNIKKESQHLGLGLYALWIPMLFWSVTTLTDHLGLLFFWAIAPFLVRDFLNTKRPLLWGIMITLPFLVRPQLILMSVTLALLYCFKNLSFKNCLKFFLGILLVICFYGLIDYLTWGTWFGSLKNQIFYGFEKSKFYGTSPLWDYPRRIVEDLGLIIPICALLFSGYRFYKKETDTRLLLLILPCLILFLFYSFVSHKETRFIIPIYPLFFVLIAWGIDPWIQKISIPKFLWVPATVAALVIIPLEIQNKKIYLSSVDILKLENAIYKDSRELKLTSADCILLLNHNWSWTRGMLGVGSSARMLDDKLETVSALDMRTCAYAIVPESRTFEFLGKIAASQTSYISMNLKQNKYALYKRLKR